MITGYIQMPRSEFKGHIRHMIGTGRTTEAADACSQAARRWVIPDQPRAVLRGVAALLEDENRFDAVALLELF